MQIKTLIQAGAEGRDGRHPAGASYLRAFQDSYERNTTTTDRSLEVLNCYDGMHLWRHRKVPHCATEILQQRLSLEKQSKREDVGISDSNQVSNSHEAAATLGDARHYLQTAERPAF